MNAGTRMFREAAAAPEAVRSQLLANRGAVDELAKVLRQNPPRAVVTCARGSSDHAATYARYLIATRTGLLTSSAARAKPTITTSGTTQMVRSLRDIPNVLNSKVSGFRCRVSEKDI